MTADPAPNQERHQCSECLATITSSAHSVAVTDLLGETTHFHRTCFETRRRREEANKKKWFKGTGLL